MTRKFTDTRILIATHNAGKLEEMGQLFAPRGVSVVGAAEMKLPEPEETENTFVGNAYLCKEIGASRFLTRCSKHSAARIARVASFDSGKHSFLADQEA